MTLPVKVGDTDADTDPVRVVLGETERVRVTDGAYVAEMVTVAVTE